MRMAFSLFVLWIIGLALFDMQEIVRGSETNHIMSVSHIARIDMPSADHSSAFVRF